MSHVNFVCESCGSDGAQLIGIYTAKLCQGCVEARFNFEAAQQQASGESVESSFTTQTVFGAIEAPVVATDSGVDPEASEEPQAKPSKATLRSMRKAKRREQAMEWATDYERLLPIQCGLVRHFVKIGDHSAALRQTRALVESYIRSLDVACTGTPITHDARPVMVALGELVVKGAATDREVMKLMQAWLELQSLGDLCSGLENTRAEAFIYNALLTLIKACTGRFDHPTRGYRKLSRGVKYRTQVAIEAYHNAATPEAFNDAIVEALAELASDDAESFHDGFGDGESIDSELPEVAHAV